MGKTKAHTRYEKKDGIRVPGVTTITGQLGWNKQMLITWANKLGLKGIDSNKYRDDKADIGILAHGLIMASLKEEKFDTSDYSPNQVKQAENSLLSYFEWAKSRTIRPILIEKQLVSELYGFGGTPDLYAEIDGIKTLLDYKTGKGIYLEYFIQVAGGYRLLLEENSHLVEKIVILNIPRTEDESFQQKIINNRQTCADIFLNALSIYRLHRELKKEV